VTSQGGVGTGGLAPAGTSTGGDSATGGTAGAGGSSPDLRPKTFVKRKGTEFEDAGNRYVFVGANFWQGMNLATNDASGDPPRMLRELDRMQAMGITNIRVMAASEGPDGQPYRMNPALMQSPGQYNEAVFRGLDALLDAAAARGMRAVMVLNNYWQWSGGMGQYVSWSDGSQIPYPVGSTTYQTFETYVARFYTSTSCQQNYKNHIQTVINRTNTVNGLVYRDDPTIFSWELANEPRRYPSNWINDIASYIKSLDTNHMVTTGSEGTNGGIDFQTSHQSGSIDYGTCHIWAENTNHYNPSDSTTTSLNGAITYALNYLSQHESTMRGLGKPLVLEEIGLARDGWTASGKFDPAATTTHRDQYFQTVLHSVETDMNAGQSLWGDSFWAWAGEARPSGAWTGDPPHETPGWYSVYDQDTSTIGIITTHAGNVAAFAQ
jgi:mannan endo-1,4-beta-mannosidase